MYLLPPQEKNLAMNLGKLKLEILRLEPLAGNIVSSDDKIKFSNGKISGRYIEKVRLSELEVENQINNWRDENK